MKMSPTFVLFQDGGQRKPCYVTKIHLRFESCAGILARLPGGTQPHIILYESQYPLRLMVKVICIQTDQSFLQDFDYPSMTWELEEVGFYSKRSTIKCVYIAVFPLCKSNPKESLRTGLRPLLLKRVLKKVQIPTRMSRLHCTRMHSSRMRTVRCNGRLRRGVSAWRCAYGGVCLGGVCLVGGYLPRGVSAWWGYLPGGCLLGGGGATAICSVQECIPVGCVPSAAMAVSMGGGRGVCLGVCLRECLPGGVPRGVSDWWGMGGICLGGVCLGGVCLVGVDRILDTH